MYSARPGLILAFHGTDKSVVQKVVSETQHLEISSNIWDWLGHGAYFWENSPTRALEFAETSSKRKDSKIKSPAVLSAVLDLGYCLDLLDYKNLSILKAAYEIRKDIVETSGFPLPQNKPSKGDHNDLLVRELDCVVIETVHDINRSRNQRPFDSVKGVFWEGPPLYPNAGFREKDHIQICIRNPNCIKGFFVPREKAEFPG
ncbi:hypothetical protein [Dawidia soli]|uniref:Uncharacterized protein n=1 Tax=Dawidia soli TaxID=2782352 RepID=A0AAP2D8C8_9BACT|nr:hypothetical protein [Dawidia soli]MBT1687273.1 hypothetical protein [Dawidia soli]